MLCAPLWTFDDVTDIPQAQQVIQAERGLFVGGPVVVLLRRLETGRPLEYVSPSAGMLFGRTPAALTLSELVADKPIPYDDTDVHELQLIADGLWRIVLRRRAEKVLAEAKVAADYWRC